MASVEFHNIPKMVRQNNGRRWAFIPSLWIVELIDSEGNSSGYFPALFDIKSEAQEAAKLVHGTVFELDVQKVGD